MTKPARDKQAGKNRPFATQTTMGSAGADHLLSEGQWLWLSARLPLTTEKRGRPPNNNRAVVEGIFWVAWSGQPWRSLPVRYGKWSSVYRRFQRWTRNGVFAALMEHIRPFECGPQAADAETRRLYEGLAVVRPLALRGRAGRRAGPG